MKNITKLFAIAVVVLGFSTTSFGQDANALASANVVENLKITAGTGVDGLNFGKINRNAGDVIVSTVGIATGVGVVGTSASSGKFTIEGSETQGFHFTMGANVKLSAVAPTVGSDMPVTAWTYSIGGSSVIESTRYEIPTGANSVDLMVGATLTKGTDQGVGNYEGQYTITFVSE